MLKKLLTLFRRSRPNDPPADLVEKLTNAFMQKVAATAQQKDLAADYLAPREAQVIFTFIQSLFLEWVLRKTPAFSPEALRLHDVELYWKIIDFAVCVQRFQQPVRADSFQAFLTDYAIAFSDGVALVEAATASHGN